MSGTEDIFPETGPPGLFEPDNFDQLDSRFFGSLRQSGLLYADPSGWIDTVSQSASFLCTASQPYEYGRYYLDVGNTLAKRKDSLCDLISAWEGTEWCRDEVTICPSVSAASLAVLAGLKMRGVTRLLLETPCYFATLEQAGHLGIDTQLLPSYLRNDFRNDDLPDIVSNLDNTAVWITQPRAALGLDQNPDFIIHLMNTIRENSFLVVDEATDQTFPSILGQLKNHPHSDRLIKLKNFTKPMGLNGVRLAAILHGNPWRTLLTSCLETFGGSVDINSLELVVSFANNIGNFNKMLRVANGQVTDLCQVLQKLSWGTEVNVLPLSNGYIGSLALPIASSPETFPLGRRHLLEFCQNLAMPIILGPSMYFACDRPTEFVRLNYLSHPQHLERAVEALADFSKR